MQENMNEQEPAAEATETATTSAIDENGVYHTPQAAIDFMLDNPPFGGIGGGGATTAKPRTPFVKCRGYRNPCADCGGTYTHGRRGHGVGDGRKQNAQEVYAEAA